VSHINPICVTKSPIYLNTAIISDPNLLILPLISLLICKSDHIQNLIFCVLIDSGPIYCITFILKYSIPTKLTLSVELKLFDELLNNIIIEITFLSVVFLSRD